MKKIINGFTLVELIVVIAIIAILTATGFYSYVGYISDARDSQRISDVAKISSSLKLYKYQKGSYPLPGDYFNITNSGTIVANQGLLNKNVYLSTLDGDIPTDPKTKLNYFYSITKSKGEFQLSMSLENGGSSIAFLDGNYKSVSKNVLPSITLAINSYSGASVEINNAIGSGSTNRNYFIFNKEESLPYGFTQPYNTYYDNISLDTKLGNNKLDLWQNSDYASCSEIYDDGKAISSGYSLEYQILQNNILTNTGCTF